MGGAKANISRTSHEGVRPEDAMDIGILAQNVTAILAPLLPYLAKAGEKTAETAIQEIGKVAGKRQRPCGRGSGRKRKGNRVRQRRSRT
jgi:hypothetical protein